MQRYSALPTSATGEPPQKSTFQESDLTSPHGSVEEINRWPSEPKTIAQSRPSWIWRLLPHILLLLIPIASIGLGIAVQWYDGRPVSNGGGTVKQAMAVPATIWPILFAAVLGPGIKAVTLYRAERGVRFGVLDLLSSSRTLFNTLQACATVRVFTVWPIILVLVWSLSPIGGQAALRSMNSKQVTTTFEYCLATYPTTNLSLYNSAFTAGSSSRASGTKGWQALISTVFNAQDIGLLYANGSSTNFDRAVQRVGGRNEAIKMTRQDIWRKMRVPFLHALPGYNRSSFDWTDIPLDTIPPYSSLIGVPIRGFPSMQSANTTFTIQTSYLTMQCAAARNQTDFIKKYNDSLILSSRRLNPGWIVQGYPNIYFDIVSDDRRLKSTQNFAEYWASINRTSASWSRMKMAFFVRTTNVTLCDVSTEFVESLINCSRVASESELVCAVRKMRPIPKLQQQANITALDHGRIHTLLIDIPYVTASLHPTGVSTLEAWLKDPPSTFDPIRSYDKILWYEDIRLDIISNRLAMMLNTHVQAALNQSIFVGSDGNSTADRDWRWENTNGTWTEAAGTVYHIDKTWFWLYLVATVVLTVCAVSNITLRALTLSPDLLAGISALTRDSEFFTVPAPASGLFDSDRSQLLKDEWVMIQDVMPDSAVGRIAFSNFPSRQSLERDRKYL